MRMTFKVIQCDCCEERDVESHELWKEGDPIPTFKKMEQILLSQGWKTNKFVGHICPVCVAKGGAQ
jgi:hypothetical protein